MSSQLSLKVSVKENSNEIQKALLTALLPQIDRFFSDRLNNIDNEIADILIKNIINQPEYSSLMGGELQAQFGIPDPQSRISEILDTIRSGRSIRIKKPSIVGLQIKAGLTIQMVTSDFSDLISLGGASVVSEKGTQLNWLEWLLLEGDSIIISDHIFIAGSYPTSRTGMGIMYETAGGSWRVPPQFAGSIKNNWITRAIDASVTEIEKLIGSKLKG